MSKISALSGSSAQTQTSHSTVNGKGLRTTFDSNNQSVVSTLSAINQAFKNSFLRLNTAVSIAQVSKDSLEGLLSTTQKLIEVTQRSEDENLSASERQALDSEFQRHIKKFKSILAKAKSSGVNLLDKDELTATLDNAGVDIKQTGELADALGKIAGLDHLLGSRK